MRFSIQNNRESVEYVVPKKPLDSIWERCLAELPDYSQDDGILKQFLNLEISTNKENFIKIMSMMNSITDDLIQLKVYYEFLEIKEFVNEEILSEHFQNESKEMMELRINHDKFKKWEQNPNILDVMNPDHENFLNDSDYCKFMKIFMKYLIRH